MAQTVLTFAAHETRLRWREQYVTEGVNSKLAAVIPAGVYRGFKVEAAGIANQVKIVADPTVGDHVAVYETLSGYSLTVRKLGGDFGLTLAGGTWIVVIEAAYSPQVDTLATITAYTQAEYDNLANKAERVVLAKIVMNSEGVPVLDFSTRSSAWLKLAPEATPWAPALTNGFFELCRPDTGQAFSGKYDVPYWELALPANVLVTGKTSDADRGNFQLEVTTTQIVNDIDFLGQWVNLPVKSGQQLKLKIRHKRLTASAVLSVKLDWAGVDGAAGPSSTVSFGPSTTAEFTSGEQTIQVPSGAAVLERIRLSVTQSSASTALRIGSVEVWAETDAYLDPIHDRGGHPLIAKPLLLQDPTQRLSTTLEALLKFNASAPATQGKVTLGRKDGLDGSNSTTRSPIFELAQMILGVGLATGDVTVPRIQAPPGSIDSTLLLESYVNGQRGVRMYSAYGSLFLTVNAKQTGSAWSKDVNDSIAWMIALTAAGFEIREQAYNVNNWGAWSSTPFKVDATGLITYLSRQNVLGGELLGVAADAALPRIQTNAAASGVSAFTNLWQLGPSAGAKVRFYSAAGVGRLLITVNAVFSGTWAKDTAGTPAYKIDIGIGAGGLADANIVLSKRTADSAWNDVQWDASPITKFNLADGTITVGTLAATTVTATGLVSSDKLELTNGPANGSTNPGDASVNVLKTRTIEVAAGTTPAAAAVPKLKMTVDVSPTAPTYQLMWEVLNPSVDDSDRRDTMRWWANDRTSRTIVITRNAKWNPTTSLWEPDVVGETATRITLGSELSSIDIPVAAASWDDDVWNGDSISTATPGWVRVSTTEGLLEAQRLAVYDTDQPAGSYVEAVTLDAPTLRKVRRTVEGVDVSDLHSHYFGDQALGLMSLPTHFATNLLATGKPLHDSKLGFVWVPGDGMGNVWGKLTTDLTNWSDYSIGGTSAAFEDWAMNSDWIVLGAQNNGTDRLVWYRRRTGTTNFTYVPGLGTLARDRVLWSPEHARWYAWSSTGGALAWSTTSAPSSVWEVSAQSMGGAVYPDRQSGGLYFFYNLSGSTLTQYVLTPPTTWTPMQIYASGAGWRINRLARDKNGKFFGLAYNSTLYPTAPWRLIQDGNAGWSDTALPVSSNSPSTTTSSQGAWYCAESDTAFFVIHHSVAPSMYVYVVADMSKVLDGSVPLSVSRVWDVDDFPGLYRTATGERWADVTPTGLVIAGAASDIANRAVLYSISGLNAPKRWLAGATSGTLPTINQVCYADGRVLVWNDNNDFYYSPIF